MSRKASQLKLQVNLFFKKAFGVNWKLAKMAKTINIQVVQEQIIFIYLFLSAQFVSALRNTGKFVQVISVLSFCFFFCFSTFTISFTKQKQKLNWSLS